MDKNAIKKYAVWARTELITRVSQRAEKYDITAEADANASSVNGVLLSDAEKKQRKALIEQVRQKGFDQVMEEVAYTWFNRFIALRFMEVNGYLPSHIRVFTDENNNFKPQILAEAIHLELDGLDMEKVYEMKSNNENDELYKYLIITQCNELNKILPGMFQKISDYTELLFPDNVLREGSVLEQIVAMIPEDNWKDQVQIIGWLYQYYNIEPKEKVFNELKKKKKIGKYDIPAATQLFTPDWIVRYMVDNSLGRSWIESRQDSKLSEQLAYFVPSDDKQYTDKHDDVNPEHLTCIDPCMGSGHVLDYIFDVLIMIYEEYGFSSKDAVLKIVNNNIFGIDIDKRATQLAYFSIMMKARSYDRRFFNKGCQPNIVCISESNEIDDSVVEKFASNNRELYSEVIKLLTAFKDAQNYGSLIVPNGINLDMLNNRLCELEEEIDIIAISAVNALKPMINMARVLNNKYSVVVTNPPYMSLAGTNPNLNKYLKNNYEDSKTDLYAAFIERCINFAKKDGFVSMITQQGWMFISSFEKLREKISEIPIVNMAHLGSRAFDEIGGEVVQTTSFVLRKCKDTESKGTYIRLVDASGEDEKKELFLSKQNRFIKNKKEFERIPGSPIVYWLDEDFIRNFQQMKSLSELADVKNGLGTMDNNRFLRFWYEVDINNINFVAANREEFQQSSKKWAPYNKGGISKKWYGNREYIVNWKNDGAEIRELAKNATGGRIVSVEFYFRESISWSYLSQSNFAARYFPTGTMFDSIGTSCFPKDGNIFGYLGVLNSKAVKSYLEVLAPTLAYNPGSVGKLPIFDNIPYEIAELSKRNVELTKQLWDSDEISFDFKKHPLLNGKKLLKEAYVSFTQWWNEIVSEIRKNESRIDEICIDKYGLSKVNTSPEEEMCIEVPSEKEMVISLVSYSVGCMFGRYSLDNDGICYAGGLLDNNRYIKFACDKDNIIPITDDEYFQDDIVSKFIEFISTCFGEETLKENLSYIASALQISESPAEAIRQYFNNSFYSDHLKKYLKSPIYWMVDSGKKNGFKCLFYIHRYRPDTIARVRTDYVHELQSRYKTRLEGLEKQMNDASGSLKIKLSKQKKHLEEQSEEVHSFEEKVHHLADQMIEIDLDDGVKKNYTKLETILSKIK